jgi:eukaryotic-like serine/threonine-protein kinase
MNRIRLLAIGMAFMGIAQSAEQSPAPAPAAFQLALVDLQGQKKVLGTLPNSVFSPRLSPDGTKVVFELADVPIPANAPQVMRLYVAALDQLDKRRVLQQTVTATRNLAGVWSDDGDWIVFMASGNGADSLYLQRSDGGVQPKYLLDGRAPEGFYKNGQIAFITRTADRDYGISLLDLNTRKATVLVDIPGSEQHSSRISSDGKWLAYASNETGRQEVWLEPLPQTGKRYQLTKQGGRHPLWSPDGTKLYFDQGDKMFRLDLTLGDAPSARDPVPLPISGFQQGDLRRQYDITPDGKGFLMLFPTSASP